MEVAAIQTEATTTIKSPELIEKTMRVRAKLSGGEEASTVTVETDLVPNTEESQLFWAFLREGEEHYHRKNSATVEFRVEPKNPKRSLTAKQRLALKYIAQWRMGDPDRQTETLDQFMRDLEENRRGGR